MLTKKQVQEIKKHLERAQNPLFLFDNDLDGLCSFLLLRRYLDRGKGFPIKSAPDLTKEYLRKVHELNPDYIFILDKPRVSEDFFEEVEKINLPVVWIDHHQSEREKIPFFVNYYNPLYNRTKKNEPVTALCYQITNRKEDRWIALIGSIADKFLPDFYPEFRKENKELTIDSKDSSEIYYNSEIGEIARMLSFSLMDRTTNVINTLKFLMRVKSPYDVLEENNSTSSIHKRAKELYEKYKKLIEKAKKEAEESGKFLFFKYGSDISMSADIANRLIYLFPEKVIAVVRINDSRASCSIRGKNIRGKVVKAIENIEGATGGGHENAVGAQMRSGNVEEFEKILREMVE